MSTRWPTDRITLRSRAGVDRVVWGRVYGERTDSEITDFDFGDAMHDIIHTASAEIQGGASPGESLINTNGVEWVVADVVPSDDRYGGGTMLSLQRKLIVLTD